MKVIGLGLQKGGVGKTSVSVALAAELAKSSKVLLIDADPQGNASGALLKEIGEPYYTAIISIWGETPTISVPVSNGTQ